MGKTPGPRIQQSPFADADARLFVSVAHAGSFAAAAALAGMTPSAVSKAVARLESALGTKLLVRTTRALHLTDEGSAFRDRCARAFALLGEAADEAARGAHAVTGTVRVGLPPLFGTHFLPAVLARLATTHPELRVEIVSTMRASDLVDRGLDLAIVVGALPDSSSVARPLGYGRFVVVAAPSYLARRGAPRSPADLTEHACLAYAQPDGRDAPFLFARAPFELVAVRGPARSDDMHHLAAMAEAGLGVAQLPMFAVADALSRGALVTLLDDLEPEPKLASLVFPAGRELPRRVRVLVEALSSPASVMRGTTTKRR
ncbi:MAG: LysR family transcriptional regulator [Polyangiaceae bacterium]